MIILKIKKGKHIPIYQQVYDQVVNLIMDETLKVGEKLPSTRKFAEKHNISRTSVERAYEELWLKGYIESHQGSYTRVKTKNPSTSTGNKSDSSPVNWKKRFKDCCFEINEEKLYRTKTSGNIHKDVIDLSWFDIDERLIPMKEFKRSFNDAVHDFENKIFMYSDFQGFLPLREFISRRLNTHGMLIKPDEILITNGSQHALDLIVRLLCKAESKVIVEKPTYLNMIPLFKNAETELLEAEMKDDGICLEQVEKYLIETKPAFIYTMPNFQNPTGISMSQVKREKLLNIAQKYKVPIVEDGFEEEMKFMGKIPLSIKAIDSNNLVIYVGSFSKVFSTGLRLGWVVAHKTIIEKLVAIKRFSDISTSSVIQAIMYKYCSAGYFDNHIKKLNRVFKRRMHLALKTTDKYIKVKEVVWTKPQGGYLIWFKLHCPGRKEHELMEIIERNGINVNPGSRFMANKKDFLFFRITISRLNENEIVTGIKRLGNAINEFYNVK